MSGLFSRGSKRRAPDIDPDKPVTTVRVALDPGCGNKEGVESLELTLNADHTVKQLHDAVHVASGATVEFDLMGGFPPAVLDSSSQSSLTESGLLLAKVMQRKKLPQW